jgi:hypothetical protein
MAQHHNRTSCSAGKFVLYLNAVGRDLHGSCFSKVKVSIAQHYSETDRFVRYHAGLI